MFTAAGRPGPGSQPGADEAAALLLVFLLIIFSILNKQESMFSLFVFILLRIKDIYKIKINVLDLNNRTYFCRLKQFKVVLKKCVCVGGGGHVDRVQRFFVGSVTSGSQTS